MQRVVVDNVDLLRHLAAGAVASGGELARQMGRDRGNTNKTIGLLAEAGVVVREPAIDLTDQGRRTLQALDLDEGRLTLDAASRLIAHGRIGPDPGNPRKAFDQEELADLARSIEAHGLLQPLVVCPADAAGLHRLVAGERRWRAIGLLIEEERWDADKPIPCRIRDEDEDVQALAAIIENLQRVDLAPLEEAQAFQALIDSDHGWTTATIAGAIGKSQRFVQMRLQLLTLPADAKNALAAGLINVDQARVLAQTPRPKVEAPNLEAGDALIDKFRPEPPAVGSAAWWAARPIGSPQPDEVAGEDRSRAPATVDQPALIPPTAQEAARLAAVARDKQLEEADECIARNLFKLVSERMKRDRAQGSGRPENPLAAPVAHTLLDRARAGDFIGVAVCAAQLAAVGDSQTPGLAAGRAGHARVLPADVAQTLTSAAVALRPAIALEALSAAVAVFLTAASDRTVGFVSCAPIADEVMHRLTAAFAAANLSADSGEPAGDGEA